MARGGKWRGNVYKFTDTALYLICKLVAQNDRRGSIDNVSVEFLKGRLAEAVEQSTMCGRMKRLSLQRVNSLRDAASD